MKECFPCASCGDSPGKIRQRGLRLEFSLCHGTGCSHCRLSQVEVEHGGMHLSPRHLEGWEQEDQEDQGVVICEFVEHSHCCVQSLSTACSGMVQSQKPGLAKQRIQSKRQATCRGGELLRLVCV